MGMPTPRLIRTKVCLIGDQAVGKTSLIRRYVLDEFEDRYLMTLGTKVSKKVVDLEEPSLRGPIRLEMSLWDIMGQAGLMNLLMESYFTGASGILAVLDFTRPATLQTLDVWLGSVARITGRVPLFIAANKADLTDEALFGPSEVAEVARTHGCEYLATSAKTGQNVEAVFQRLGLLVVRRLIPVP